MSMIIIDERSALVLIETAYSEFPEDFSPQPGNIVVVKRHWGAFTGTELDLQLRRRGVTQIVLAGIATTLGVESTAGSAWELRVDGARTLVEELIGGAL